MFFWRHEVRAGWGVAFTDVQAGSMSTSVPVDSSAVHNRAAVSAALGLDSGFQFMSQVHGNQVQTVVAAQSQPEADGLVSARQPLAVLVADCLPVLLLGDTLDDAEDRAGVAAAVHAGRRGVAANIMEPAVAAMREAGAKQIEAWIGPAICGKCYEVPEQLRAEVSALVPETFAQTSWGTPSLDLRAGATAQLSRLGVQVTQVDRCTREETSLFSHRRGSPVGRFAGLIYRIGPGER